MIQIFLMNIITTMMACAELYEMLLASVETYNIEEGKDTVVKFANGMINVYVVLIKKGLKTIDDVPEKLKQQVIEEIEKETPSVDKLLNDEEDNTNNGKDNKDDKKNKENEEKE